jgi:hypothetical protein
MPNDVLFVTILLVQITSGLVMKMERLSVLMRNQWIVLYVMINLAQNIVELSFLELA